MMSKIHIIRHARILIAGAALTAILATLGCVQRTITITSEPEGVLTFLNDQEVGRTPLTVPFTWYGTYDVRLEKEGHKSLWTTAKAEAPWWELPGPDLFAEMVPDGKVQIEWHFKLDPRDGADKQQLLDHAGQMRAMLRNEANSQLADGDENNADADADSDGNDEQPAIDQAAAQESTDQSPNATPSAK